MDKRDSGARPMTLYRGKYLRGYYHEILALANRSLYTRGLET